nr:fumarate reductase/succinate dehydrogenase flavoprotein subunit [Actinomyces culturomici]
MTEFREDGPPTTRIDLRRARDRRPNVEQGASLDPREPGSAPERMWDEYVAGHRLVGPGNRKRFTVLVVGTGLAGAGAAASLSELGYRVEVLTFHDSPRRAHSVAAQGGINAARARGVDGDALARFVVDTVKGGDFRARESEVFRLGELSSRVIDHMNALGVPFAREYGGSLATRSFGGVQVSRTFYSRGQTGQQLEIAASSALMREVRAGRILLHTRTEMLDLVVADGRAAGVVARDLETGAILVLRADAIVLATGGYGNLYFHSTLAKNSNASAAWRAHRAGAAFASPSFIQFHPTALPVSSPWQSKTTLMSESLRNDGRIWVPEAPGDAREPNEIPEDERDYYLERRYPAFGNLTPRDIASRAAFAEISSGRGVGEARNSVYLDFRDALAAQGRARLAEKYGNLFTMYRDSTGEDPYERPMRIAPGAHFAMGGLWVDYRLQSTIPGLFVAGEANAAYHGANRLGANSLLAACVDGSFTIPHVVSEYLAGRLGEGLVAEDDAGVAKARERVNGRIDALLSGAGVTPAKEFHRELGRVMYAKCGVTRTGEGLAEGAREIRQIRSAFAEGVRVTGSADSFNPDLVEAMRIGDFLELAELMCVDALNREESCGAHFRAEHVLPDGEAARDDAAWRCVSAWETSGWESGAPAFVHRREELEFRAVPLQTRNYR